MNAKFATLVRALGRVEEPCAEITTAKPVKPAPVGSYLTLAGEALSDPNICVDIFDRSLDAVDIDAICRGCGKKSPTYGGCLDYSIGRQRSDYLEMTQGWAQKHAEACRAMPPRP